MSSSSVSPCKLSTRRPVEAELPLVLTIKETAETLRCSEKHIRNLIDRKELTPFYVGRLVRIHRHELIRLINPQGEAND